jgi:acetylserotonin N-methyltransferase
VAQDITPPDPSIILEIAQGFRRSKTMFTAISMGLFDALESGAKKLDTLAGEVKAPPQTLRRLLDACVGLSLLHRDGDVYSNTASTQAFLTRTSPRRLTGYFNYSNDVLWQLWAHLEDAIREGTHRWQQTFGWDGPIFANFFRDEQAKREFLMGMHGYGLLSSPHVVTAFDLSRFRCLVDLGGATGHLAVAACQRYPNLKAIVLDLPEAVPLAREYVSASPVADRVTVVVGDFFAEPLPPGDLYTLGRILHDWNEEKILKLLRKAHDGLPAGGAVLIAEKLLGTDSIGSRWAEMQDLNMLTCTEGRERTLAEYEDLLKKSGFREVIGCRTPSPLDAVLAYKSN